MIRPTDGFTLIEVLVAIAMLSIITAATSGLIITILRSSGKTQSQQSLAYVAQDYMESVRRSWATCDLTGTPATCGATPTYSAYANGTLPDVPSTLPTGVTCTATANPTTVSTTTAPVRSRQVTLACSGGATQSYSLVVTQP